MPTGVYERTVENTRTCFKEGLAPWNKGKSGIYSPETLRRIRNGSLENKSAWKGGRYITWNGYILVYSPKHPNCRQNGYIHEHRLVVENIIGRYLLPKEEVHHLGEKDDNSPNMLIAFKTGTAHRKFQKGISVNESEIIFDGRKFQKEASDENNRTQS
jgi:uncharacterized protein (DUF1330 family)